MIVNGLQKARPGSEVKPSPQGPPAAPAVADAEPSPEDPLTPTARSRPDPCSRSFFIERPIFANVIAIVTMLIGAVTVFVLPIEQYPQITPPTVQVTTTYPGADAQVLSDTVASPIEQEVNGVEGMLYMSSTCASDGSYNLTVTFEVGTNLDMAQVLVQNRVAIAQPKLPQEVQRQGITTKKKSTAIILVVALTSPDEQGPVRQPLPEQLRHPPRQGRAEPDLRRRRHQRLRRQQLRDADLARPGEAQGPEPDHRSTCSPRSGSRTSRSPPARSAAADARRPGFQYTVTTLGRLKDPEQFGDIIVKTVARRRPTGPAPG